MWETWVWFLGGEDPLEKEMASHSRILAWKNPMGGGAWQSTAHGISKGNMMEWLHLQTAYAIKIPAMCHGPPPSPKAFLLILTKPKVSRSERKWVFLSLEMFHQRKQMQWNTLVMLPSPLVMFQEIIPPTCGQWPHDPVKRWGWGGGVGSGEKGNRLWTTGQL